MKQGPRRTIPVAGRVGPPIQFPGLPPAAVSANIPDVHKKITIAAGLLLVTVGVAVYALRANDGAQAQAPSEPLPATPVAQAPATANSGAATAASDSKAKPREGGAWSRLTEKYGGTRTNLSRKVTTDIADVLDQTLELADIGAQMGGSETLVQAASKETLRSIATQLNLTEEQKAKATGLIEGAMEKRMGAVKELATAMRDDPESMMEMLLAGDAVSRNEMTQAEYDESTAATREMLGNITGFVGGRNPAAMGAPLLGDDEFTGQLAALLTPEQRASLAEYSQKMAAQASQPNRGGMPLQNGTIPVMELEKLEQAMASAKQMTGGLRQLMEGMKGLQQNLPQPEGQ